jgi:hypothetical protein
MLVFFTGADVLPAGPLVLPCIPTLFVVGLQSFCSSMPAYVAPLNRHHCALLTCAPHLVVAPVTPHRNDVITNFNLPPVPLARFLRRMEEGYKANPYHNATHAADVLQTLNAIIFRGGLAPGYVDPLHLMAGYVAAVSVGAHLGRGAGGSTTAWSGASCACMPTPFCAPACTCACQAVFGVAGHVANAALAGADSHPGLVPQASSCCRFLEAFPACALCCLLQQRQGVMP